MTSAYLQCCVPGIVLVHWRHWWRNQEWDADIWKVWTNCVTEFCSMNMCTWGQNDLFLMLCHDLSKPLSKFRMPEYLIKSQKVIQARENMKRKQDLSLNTCHRFFKPIKLLFSCFERAFVVKFKIHGVKSEQRNFLVGEVVSIETSYHESFSSSIVIKTFWLMVDWEPDIK